MKITKDQQLVLNKLADGWKLHSDLHYDAPVWLSKGQGGWADPYQTISIRRSTLNALTRRSLIRYNHTEKVYEPDSDRLLVHQDMRVTRTQHINEVNACRSQNKLK